MEERILRVETVAERLGYSVRTVWRRAAAGLLPPPVKDVGCTGWLESEVNAHIEQKKRERHR